MDTSLQSDRDKQTWAIVRRLRRNATQHRDKAAPPGFIADGVGEVTTARVTEQVREIIHRHRKSFPEARLREVLLAGDARTDPELSSWGGAFASDLLAAFVRAARAAFRRGVEDGPPLDSRKRFHPATSLVLRNAPLNAAFQLLEEPISREVQEIVAQLWTMINHATADEWDVESILEAVRHYLFSLADRDIALKAWAMVYRHWHAGQHWIHEQAGARYKIWHVDDLADNCDSCLGNLDAGEIRIAEVFPSGHPHPMVHWRCQCWLEFTGMPRSR